MHSGIVPQYLALNKKDCYRHETLLYSIEEFLSAEPLGLYEAFRLEETLWARTNFIENLQIGDYTAQQKWILSEYRALPEDSGMLYVYPDDPAGSQWFYRIFGEKND